MSRYIDVDNIQERICKEVNNPAIRVWLNALINEEPIADVVKVGRCEECKYAKENELLKKRISDKKHALFEQQAYWKAIKGAKAEAYKEFANIMKKNVTELWDYDNGTFCPVYVLDKSVDNLLKEMVGEEE